MTTRALENATVFELAPFVKERITTLTGAASDVRQIEGLISITQASAIGSTGDTLDGKIQDSPDGSTGWADLTGKVFVQVTDAAAAFETIGVNKDDTRGWVRYVGTIAGGTPSFDFGVFAVAFNKTR